MPLAPRPPRRGTSLSLLLACTLATSPLSACDTPPTAAHPLVHLFTGTTYSGRPFPTPICPHDPPSSPVVDSVNFITHGGDSAIVRTVLRDPIGGGISAQETSFRFTVRDGQVLVLDAAGHEEGVFGTFTTSGIDAPFSAVCRTPDGGLERLTGSVHFRPSY